MLTGIPGAAQDWVTAGQVVPVADAWARAHHGFAPVMIFVDENGRGDHDTECVNGAQGAAASYLSVDLPGWVDHTLRIHPDPRTWGVVGFSEGGTCALGLALESPEVFGTFLDIAGDEAPNLGDAAATLRDLYGGDEVAARSFQPQLILSSHHYTGVQGWFAAGAGDRSGLAAIHDLAGPAEAAGVDVHIYEAPGGHTWDFARRTFAQLYTELVAAVSSPSFDKATPG
jgi:S-formylglutathione hydrolase FrmB